MCCCDDLTLEIRCHPVVVLIIACVVGMSHLNDRCSKCLGVDMEGEEEEEAIMVEEDEEVGGVVVVVVVEVVVSHIG